MRAFIERIRQAEQRMERLESRVAVDDQRMKRTDQAARETGMRQAFATVFGSIFGSGGGADLGTVGLIRVTEACAGNAVSGATVISQATDGSTYRNLCTTTTDASGYARVLLTTDAIFNTAAATITPSQAYYQTLTHTGLSNGFTYALTLPSGGTWSYWPSGSCSGPVDRSKLSITMGWGTISFPTSFSQNQAHYLITSGTYSGSYAYFQISIPTTSTMSLFISRRTSIGGSDLAPTGTFTDSAYTVNRLSSTYDTSANAGVTAMLNANSTVLITEGP